MLDTGNDGDIQGVLCIELGLYTASTGQKFVTAQVDGWCNNFVNDDRLQCSNIVVNATVANGAGYTDWTTHACGHQNGGCQTIDTSFSADNYFYPFGGLPITNGSCINNVWVVLNVQGTYITLPVGTGKNVYLSSNLEDGHFSEVCLDNGSFSRILSLCACCLWQIEVNGFSGRGQDSGKMCLVDKIGAVRGPGPLKHLGDVLRDGVFTDVQVRCDLDIRAALGDQV